MKVTTLYKIYDYGMIAGSSAMLAGGVGLIHKAIKEKDYKLMAMGGVAIVAALYVAKSISMICYIDEPENGENPSDGKPIGNGGKTTGRGGTTNTANPTDPTNADVANKLIQNVPNYKGLSATKLENVIATLPAADKQALINSVEHGDFGSIDLKVGEEILQKYLNL